MSTPHLPIELSGAETKLRNNQYVMTQQEKAVRRQRIIAGFLAGTAPYDIARRFGLTPNYVRSILRSEGVCDEVKNYGTEVDSVWSLPDEDRRLAFARRAAAGARAARQAPHAER